MQLQLRRAGVLLGVLAFLAVLTATPGLAVESATPRVNINTASADELAALPGIGETKAQAIVEHRTAEPFQVVDDLKRVQGIGDRTMEALRPNVTVGDGAQ